VCRNALQGSTETTRTAKENIPKHSRRTAALVRLGSGDTLLYIEPPLADATRTALASRGPACAPSEKPLAQQVLSQWGDRRETFGVPMPL